MSRSIFYAFVVVMIVSFIFAATAIAPTYANGTLGAGGIWAAGFRTHSSNHMGYSGAQNGNVQVYDAISGCSGSGCNMNIRTDTDSFVEYVSPGLAVYYANPKCRNWGGVNRSGYCLWC